MARRQLVRPDVDEELVKQLGPAILKRDGSVCQCCGAKSGDISFFDQNRRIGLTFGYAAAPPIGGNPIEYIRTICEDCHEGFRTLPYPKSSRIELLTFIGRASVEDQRAVLKWLSRRLATDSGFGGRIN